MKKFFVISLVLLMCLCLIPGISAEKSNNEGVELETSIMTGVNVWFFGIYVDNVGEEVAHNVRLTDVTVDGNVIFNFQESKQYERDINPGAMTLLDPNSGVIGYGKFDLSMTITCDEGCTLTSSVEGFMFGPFYIIP